MRKIVLFVTIFLFSYSLLSNEKLRRYVDDNGYCKTPEQIEKIVELSTALEQESLREEKSMLKSKNIVAAICPHDDHMYAAREYIHAIPYIAYARTVVIFGIVHLPPRLKLKDKDAENTLIFDDYEEWYAPYSPAKVDVKLRKYIKNRLDENSYIVSNTAHSLEHSIEAKLAFLKYYNKDVKILPIMVNAMNVNSFEKISDQLSDILISYIKENKLKLGKDITFLMSTDCTHYGLDYGHYPFGLDEEGHKRGTERDITIGKKYLSDNISEEKIMSFVEKVLSKEINTWCGRFAIPFGLLTVKKVVKEIDGKGLRGFPTRYSDNYSNGLLPAYNMGIGVTHGFSLKHWVGHWAIVYSEE